MAASNYSVHMDTSNNDVRPFPLTKEEFDTDERVSFSRISEKYTLEQDDGTEFEFDDILRRWIPVLDESLAEQQSKAYAVEGVDETESATPARAQKKRKNYTSNDPTANGNQPDPAEPTPLKKKSKKNGKDEKAAPVNKAVYVTNLPRDVTVSELHILFARCGVIAEELDGGKPRIKLYLDEQGTPKGDALVVYFRPESVNLAIDMLDDTDLRFGVPDAKGTMKVQAADYSYKQVKEGDEAKDGVVVKKSAKEKKKVIAKAQKLNNKLADWDDDDPSALQSAGSSRWDKVVILKHMFTLAELEADPAAMLDVKEDIREECEKLGPVTNVTLYDKEEDGVASVRFANVESAHACIRLMNGRFFAGAQIEAYTFDGIEKFKKSGKVKIGDDDDTEEKERLDKFGEWLEGGEKEGLPAADGATIESP